MRWNPLARFGRAVAHRFTAASQFFGKGSPSARAARDSADFTSEAFDDEGMGRSVAGSGQLELSEGERIRCVRLSRRLYYRNGIYGEIVDLFVAWVLGDGVVLKHEDEAADKFLQEVLNDPLNAFHAKLADRVTRWFTDGELPFTFLQGWRARPQAAGVTDAERQGQRSAAIYFGRADPFSIGEVKVDALDVDEVKELTLTPIDGDMLTGALLRKSLPAAKPGRPPEDLGEDAPGAAAILLWRLNPLGVRGIPLLCRIVDKADVLDRIVQGIADKVEITNRFVWHATYEATGDKEADEAFEKKLHGWLTRGSKAGESAVTKAGVTIAAVAPDLKLADTSKSYDVGLDYLLGSVGVPRHWFASGGDTNRATAVEQGSPIHRMIRKKQSELATILRQLCAYVVYLGQLSGNVSQDIDPEDVSVTLPDAATRDSALETGQLSTLSLATRDLVERGAITREEEQRILRRAVEGLPFGEELDEDMPPLPDPPETPPPVPGMMPGMPKPQGMPPKSPPPKGAGTAGDDEDEDDDPAGK